MNDPAVSVVLPVRDAVDTLATAVGSVLEQQGVRFELVVVDDGSTDGTSELLARLAERDNRLIAIFRPAAGLVSALNAGLAAARAPLIARMDADDRCLAGRLAKQHAALCGDSALTLCSCLVQSAERDDNLGWTRYLEWLNRCTTDQQIRQALLIESPLPHPSVMVRKQAVLDVGGYREFDGPEDYDLWLRLAKNGGRFAKLPEVLLHWSDPPARLTRTDPRYRSEAFIELKADYLAEAVLPSSPRRKLAIWGAGRYGKRFGRALQQRGCEIACFFDIDPKKIGRQRRGCPVLSPERGLAEYPDAMVIAAVPVVEARELIAGTLERAGYRIGKDFLICA
ncbi:MAG: glycosyltransferase [Deltaproteobacteria bacterium]|nr:glycosyltransferase [Deltaproteobacteria bacterium]